MSGAVDLDEIAGARATHRFCRMSASKARVVLALIRELDLDKAREELQFCDRGAAQEITKVLSSAVANAENNENLLADELYVAECWADEGPTLKRWRPRARGRATRINKRTCHITVVVAQLDDEELEMRALRLAASGGDAGASRSARVAASRAQDESGEDAEVEVDQADDEDAGVEAEAVVEDATAEVESVVTDEAGESSAVVDPEAESDDASADDGDAETAEEV
jgi:large subunit ribosomal protein L22